MSVNTTSSKGHVVTIPIKKYSERIPNKNFRLLDGKPLYQILPKTLLDSGCFDKVVIDTDSPEIVDWARANGIHIIDRAPHLATNAATGNMVLRYDALQLPGYAYYWQAFVPTPYISLLTVQRMVGTLVSASECTGYDSILSVKAHRSFFWSNGMPLNFRHEVNARTQDLNPVYEEKCGLFGVTSEALAITGTRTGLKPLFYPLPTNECLDIDWPADLPQQ